MRGSNLLVSIIIPLFNAKAYVDDIVQNINSQTYKNLEIIFVDDGSIDNTIELLKTKKIDAYKVRYLQQNNSGPSVARNKGLDYASGDFVVFWDADDVVDANIIELLVENIKNNELGMVSMTRRYIDDERCWDEKEEIVWPSESNEIEDLFSEILSSNHLYIITTCNKIYKRDIIETYDLRFSEEIAWAEDLKWNVNYIVHVNTVSFNENCNYYYSIRKKTSSLSKVYKKDNITSLYSTYKQMLNIIENRNFKNKEKCYMWCINNAISNCANVFRGNSCKDSVEFLKRSCFSELTVWSMSAKPQGYMDSVILACVKGRRYDILCCITYVVHILRSFNGLSIIKKIAKI